MAKLWGGYKSRDAQLKAQIGKAKGGSAATHAGSPKATPAVKKKKKSPRKGGETSEETWLREQLKKARASQKKK